MDTVVTQKLVGPIIRGVDIEVAEALLEAIEDDNPDVEITFEDRGGYIRIQAPQYCRVTQQSLEKAMGRPFQLFELEPSLAGFAGRIKEKGDDELIWYLERKD